MISLQNLKTLRHPNILHFVQYVQAEGQSYLFTEKAAPLSIVIKQQTPLQVRLGLKKVAEALDFLKNLAGMTIKVSKASLYVTRQGNWKLAPTIE